MSLAESIIKKRLDGSFFKYLPYLDAFKRIEVPVDFIPTHENSTEAKSAKISATWHEKPRGSMARNKKRVPTPEQAELVRKYQAQGWTKSRIYEAMQANGFSISRTGVDSVLAGEI